MVTTADDAHLPLGTVDARALTWLHANAKNQVGSMPDCASARVLTADIRIHHGHLSDVAPERYSCSGSQGAPRSNHAYEGVGRPCSLRNSFS